MFDRWSPVGGGRTWNFKGLEVNGKCFRESCSSDTLRQPKVDRWMVPFLSFFLSFIFF